MKRSYPRIVEPILLFLEPNEAPRDSLLTPVALSHNVALDRDRVTLGYVCCFLGIILMIEGLTHVTPSMSNASAAVNSDHYLS